MDEWNRNDQNEYKGVNAQRRNRRRVDPANRPDVIGEPDTEAPFEYETPAKREIPETPVKPEEFEDTAEPDSPEELESLTETEASVKSAVPAEPDTPEKPETLKEDPGILAEPVVQAPDSRVPPEARRMAAAPYGVHRKDAKRPGTRPQVAPRRPPMPEERRPTPRPRREMPLRDTLPENADPIMSGMRQRPERVSIGYAPGRMSDGETRQIPVAEPARESIYSRDAKAYLEKRRQPFRMEEEKQPLQDKPGHKSIRVIVALIVIAGIILSGWMLLKNRNNGDQTDRKAPQILSFEAPGPEEQIAPATLTFSVRTTKDVADLQLYADGDRSPETEIVFGDNADYSVWTIKMPVATGFEGTVMLQARRNGEEEWFNTGYTAEVSVKSPLGMDTMNGGGSGSDFASPEDDDYYDEDAENVKAEAIADGQSEQEVMPVTTAQPTERQAEQPLEETHNGEPAVVSTPEPTPTPSPTPEVVTPTPALTAEPVPEANPDLITQTTVWTGVAKKDKDYNRPAKDIIKMPEADEYYIRQLGVLTFRGDNFRRNASAGTLSAKPLKLSVLWQTDASYARGTNKTYYGYEWTGQPVIARWSANVRTKSNFMENKIDKSALKEVIIAGVDGWIRFLDLEDGKFTRTSSIKLNYPMKGTPTLDPRGAPFMTVGQFTRKMKGRTASKIGLRQYNLYTQNELKIIDGLDGKYHRPLNDIGSFETSALIDRVSDTLIVAGTNGMLYLESLSMTFDYNLGVMTISPNVVAMSSQAKGQKNNSLVAVESSLAAYSNYVYYADMGGVLRCVDTNKLQPVWAVDTGDSVMAAVALDLTKDRNLNLYTANMLNNRKKGNGNIQIRRYDALTGREIWCTDVGVFKSKKDKTKDNVGAKASPVIGQNGLNDLVYFTVTGLSEEGAEKLKLKSNTPAALIALEKENGHVVWAYGLDSRSESSPIALYDDNGNGWIVQCEQSGKIHLLDGLTGSVVDVLQIEGEIEASPAAYNNVVVFGTTGKGKAFVYGIEVKLDKPAENTDTSVPADNEQDEGSGTEKESTMNEEGMDNGEDGYGEENAYNEVEEYEDYEDYEDYDMEGEEG